MPQGEQEIDIAKNIRAIEWLKTDLVASLAVLFRAMLKGGEEAIADGLAGMIIGCYVLGRRLGIGFLRIEQKVLSKVKLNISEHHELEKWYGDLSALLRHLELQERMKQG